MIDNKIHIAIIDNGINGKICDMKLLHNVCVSEKLTIENIKEENISKNHGTICAAIIKKYLIIDAYISSIKILNSKSRSSADKLCTAIDFCIQSSVDIANISLGSTSFGDKQLIRKKINEAYYKGLIMVCASSNSPYLTYPASFSNTIGVCCDRTSFLKEGQLRFIKNDINKIEIQAFSNHTIKFKDDLKEKCGFFNSYAAPMVTAIVANKLVKWGRIKGDNIEVIKSNLLEISIGKKEKYIHGYENPDWIQNALFIYVSDSSNTYTVKEIPMSKDYTCKNSIKISKEQNIIKYLKTNAKQLNYVDTVIINSDIKISQNITKKLRDMAEDKKIKIIYADEKNLYSNVIKASVNIKYWYPMDIGLYRIKQTKGKGKIKEIEVPFLLLHEENNHSLLTILSDIKTKFHEEGYNCISFSDEIQGIFSDAEYISKEFINNDIDSIIKSVQAIVESRQIDICICGINKNKLKKLIEISDMQIELNLANKKNAAKFFSHEYIDKIIGKSYDEFLQKVFSFLKRELE